MSENSTKIKLLKLYEILRAETDEEHPISRVDPCQRVHESGVLCHVRTLSREIATLNACGYLVCNFKNDHEKFYHVPEHFFSVHELKIMIDAVRTATFKTDKMSDEPVEMFAALDGSYRANLLTRNLTTFNTCKHTNKPVHYVFLNFETALLKKKKVSFFYYDLNEKWRACVP